MTNINYSMYLLNKTKTNKKKGTEGDKPSLRLDLPCSWITLALTVLQTNKTASEDVVWFNNPAPATTMSAGPQP